MDYDDLKLKYYPKRQEREDLYKKQPMKHRDNKFLKMVKIILNQN